MEGVHIPIDVIIAHRRRKNTLEYLVQPEGEQPSAAVWTKSGDINNPDIVDKYLKHKDAYPRTRSKSRMTLCEMGVGQVNNSYWHHLLLFGVILVYLTLSHCQAVPYIGTIYNCDVTTYNGIYSLPNDLNCLQNPAGHEINSFEGLVRQFQPEITRVSIFLCTLQRIRLHCEESFLGDTIKHAPHIQYIPISDIECRPR